MTLYNECSNHSIDDNSHSNDDQDKHDFTLDIDPDRNVYNVLDVYCRYYADSQFNDCDDMCSGMSIFNAYCRSMHHSLSEQHDYLNSSFVNLNIICLCETWLNSSDNLELFKLFGLKMFQKYHTKKKGRGVAIYI